MMDLQIRDTGVIVVKAMTMKSAKSAGSEGVITFVASTENKDRDGDIIKQDGLVLTHYKTNPVFLWGHRSWSMPIGKSTRAEVKDGQFEIDVKFDLDDELGRTVYRKYKNGFLNAVSIGFMPLEWREIDDGGFIFEKSEVYEVSAVTIPSNRQALAMERDEEAETIKTVSFGSFVKALKKEAKGAAEPQIKPDEAAVDEKRFKELLEDPEKLKAFVKAFDEIMSADDDAPADAGVKNTGVDNGTKNSSVTNITVNVPDDFAEQVASKVNAKLAEIAKGQPDEQPDPVDKPETANAKSFAKLTVVSGSTGEDEE